jgi:hypothetical protein
MKIKVLTIFLGLYIYATGQTTDSLNIHSEKQSWKVFSEFDLGLIAFTGGFANYFGVRNGPHSFELGYQHFQAPGATFSGVPDGFDLTIEYIYSIHYSCFWNGKTDKGFYTRFMYHNKMQIVTEKSSYASKNLYSDCAGAELGYVWYFYKNFYLTPRIGALYYINRPQGKDNNPVLIGSSYYDNSRHKIWDTYFIPTISIGYSILTPDNKD